MILNIFLVKPLNDVKSNFHSCNRYLSFQNNSELLIMNRSGVNLGRLLTTCSLKKVNSISSPVSQFKSYHLTSNRQELLKFTATSIYTEQQRRTLFGSKEPEPAKEAKKEEGEAAEEVSEAEKALQEQVATLTEKNDDLMDKYRRSLADFENLRNRMNKQVADAKIFGIQGFCKVINRPASGLLGLSVFLGSP